MAGAAMPMDAYAAAVVAGSCSSASRSLPEDASNVTSTAQPAGSDRCQPGSARWRRRARTKRRSANGALHLTQPALALRSTAGRLPRNPMFAAGRRVRLESGMARRNRQSAPAPLA
eukprot:scaffold16219_cov102-Isochrysis_galbana.AAC.13